jgi:hypothetical protein
MFVVQRRIQRMLSLTQVMLPHRHFTADVSVRADKHVRVRGTPCMCMFVCICVSSVRECAQRVQELVLNRPEAMNALTVDMCEMIKELVQQWHRESGVGAFIVKGAGGKAFCAGTHL